MVAGRPLSLEECADDSPYFRSQVSFYEEATDDLEKRLRRVGAICRERKELWKRDCALSRELQTLAEGFMNRHIDPSTAPSVNIASPPPGTPTSDWKGLNVDRRSSDADRNQCLLECMEQTVSCLKQLDEHRERFHEQVSMAVVEPLRKFVSSRVQEVRTLGQQYRDANVEASTAVDRLCACKRHELSAMAEASSSLHEARLQQHIRACSYVHALNRLHADKQPHFVQSMLDFVMCEMTTFRLGNSTFAGLDETISSTYGTLKEVTDQKEEDHAKEKDQISAELEGTLTKRLAVLETFHRVDLHLPSNTATANMERMLADAKRRHQPHLHLGEQVKMGRKSSVTAIRSGESTPVHSKAGYLFHGEHRPVVGVSWRRQYFEIESGWLRTISEGDALLKHYRVDACDGGKRGSKHTVNVDLRLCLVKPSLPTDSERNFCFRVLHPSQSLLLQAESSLELKDWMSSLQAAAVQALDSSTTVTTSSPPSPSLSVRSVTTVKSVAPSTASMIVAPPSEVVSVEGNELCADCFSPLPRWASVNLGITLCIECSGVHRSLGTHISQVRSMTLDEMRPEWKTALTSIGNKKSNATFEAFLPPGFNRQFATASDRRLFIKQKYVEMVFAEDEPREKICAQRELERSELALEREKAEEERQQWELVEDSAGLSASARTSTTSSAPAPSNTSATLSPPRSSSGNGNKSTSSPSVFHRVITSLSKH
ncbi:arf-GAP with coiled-coil, ANK repeat and PH domain-containing protein 3-like [Sycon ciliatum]|uniref:arf-GAP with coiled-coil, ANK repeat and PH domain-containing protein 3-like n=1 Tax=Sycon ciliatum TaxID=27933 RepID=UPI0020AB399C|eukprot:scpid18915/ scgid27696/ Arf-GAP with coiled-coil, ANK repeat and PH domain-containing protein 3; Centaurin-beta-5